jgi:hypothetical protein
MRIRYRISVVALVFLTLLAASIATAQNLGQTIKGVVVNPEGRPVPYATVLASLLSKPGRLADGFATRLDSSGFDESFRRFRADRSGKFTYMQSKGDTASLTFAAVAEGYSYGCNRSQQGSVKIKLSPEFRLRGRVIDERGKPISGARVRIAELGAASRDGEGLVEFPPNSTWISAITDKNGSYVLGHLPDPERFNYYEWSIEVHKQGRASIRKRLDQRYLPKEVATVEPLGCAAEGALYLPCENATAPAGIPIAINVVSEQGWEERRTETDRNGRFYWNELPPGEASMMLLPPGSDRITSEDRREMRPWVAPALNDLTLDPKRPLKVEMTLAPGTVVRGVAKTPDGRLAKGVSLVVKHAGIADESSRQERVYVNDIGEFAARVIPGNIQMTVEQYQNGYYQSDEPDSSFHVSQGDGKNVELTVRPFFRGGMSKPESLELKPGIYDLEWDKDVDCYRYLFPGCGFGDRPSKVVLALLRGRPRDVSASVVYRAYQFDGRGTDGLLMLALDRSRTAGNRYDTVYVDRNRNFDLSDDEPIRVTGDSNRTSRKTRWVAVQSHQGPLSGRHTNHSVQVRIEMSEAGAKAPFCLVQRRGAWKGSVETNNGIADIIVSDGNRNGVFGDTAAWTSDGNLRDTGDQIRIASSSAGGSITEGSSVYAVSLYTISQIASDFYSIRVSQIGNSVTIQSYAGPTGSVIISGGDIHGTPCEVRSASLQSGNASYSFDKVSDRPVTVPAGSYLVKNCHVDLKSPSPAMISCEVTAPVEVNPGRQSIVRITGDMSAAISPDVKNLVWHPGRKATITWNPRIGKDCTLTGLGYHGLNALRVRFIDNQGELARAAIASRRWSAGGSDTFRLTVPPLKAGVYTIEVSLNAQPELGILTSKRQVTIKP